MTFEARLIFVLLFFALWTFLGFLPWSFAAVILRGRHVLLALPLALAAGKAKGAIFRKGEVVRTVPEKQFLSALVDEGQRVITEKFPDWSGPPLPSDDLDAVIPTTVVESASCPGRSLPGRVARR